MELWYYGLLPIYMPFMINRASLDQRKTEAKLSTLCRCSADKWLAADGWL
jgi:hypothetical protein